MSELVSIAMWWIGLTVCATGAIGVVSKIVAWSIDRFLKTFNLTGDFLRWYAQRLKEKRGFHGA